MAVPSVGLLVPGWLLVTPKEHSLSYGAIQPKALAGLLNEVHEIAAHWEAIFGPLAWFEHGPATTGSTVGCSIDHAHLHLVPSGQLDLLAGAAEILPDLHFREVPGLHAATDAVIHGCPYLYLRTTDGRSWLAASQDIPSQAFRRIIAHQQGRPGEYDWRSFPELDVLKDTIYQGHRTLPFA